MTPDTVRWAYLLLLGREPESPEVAENWRAAGLAAMRAGMLASPEFLARAAAGLLGSPVAAAPDREALRAALALRDGAMPAEAAMDEAAAAQHDVDSLRAELLSAPDIAALLPRREGLRTRRLRLGGAEWTLLGDSRDADFAGAPGPASALAAAVRALFPGGGDGLRMADCGAGIGLASLAMAGGAPGHAALEAWEERLPEAAFLASNLVALPRARVLAMAPPPAAALAAEGVGLIRLGVAGQAMALAGGDVPLLLRFDLRALLLEERGDPRGAMAALAGGFAGAAALLGPGSPTALDEAGQDAALAAALDGPVELVLARDPGWIGRHSLV